MTTHETYMQRCLQLAKLAIGTVAPNPMVGSVLVYEDRIIGEGLHQHYGKAHAEVECITSVKEEDVHLLPQSVLYVSLEPCSHWGKTPPCADLIIEKKIRKVVVGCRDPFPEVDGRGIEKLKAAGIEVVPGVLENECKEINKRFFTYHIRRRPYLILKWAETVNKKIAPPVFKGGTMADIQNFPANDVTSLAPPYINKNRNVTISSVGDEAARLLISNAYTNRLVHKWRSEEAAILVGTNTALMDNPELNTRLWPGKNPVRLVIDMNLRLPKTLHLFNGKIPTIVFNKHQHTNNTMAEAGSIKGVHYYQLSDEGSVIQQILHACYNLKIQSILIEGGAQVLQSIVNEGLWDEARVITNRQLALSDGIAAPELYSFVLSESKTIGSDLISVYENTSAA